MKKNNRIKIAILIPSLNRHSFLRRVINYYSEVNNKNIAIFIGDSTNTSLPNVDAEMGVTVYYYHTPRLNDRKTICFLASEALKKSYDYCALHGDDDFFIPDSLYRCAQFLSKNFLYTTAQGRAARLKVKTKGKKLLFDTIDTYWSKNRLEQEDAKSRLQYFTENYYVLQFSVHRTHQFVAANDYFSNIQDRNWGELSHCLIFAMQGKSKFVECLYLIREVHDDIQHESKEQWYRSSEWESSYDQIIRYLSLTFNCSLKEVKESVNALLNSKKDNIIDKIRKRLTKYYVIINGDYSSIRMLAHPNSIYSSEFRTIMKALKKHYNKE